MSPNRPHHQAQACDAADDYYRGKHFDVSPDRLLGAVLAVGVVVFISAGVLMHLGLKAAFAAVSAL